MQKQIVKFIIVGIINTIFGYAIYTFFIFLGFNYIWAIILATIAGVLFNFKTIGKFVFESSDNSLIIKFIGVYSLVLILNILLIKTFKSYGYNDYIAGLFAVIPSAALSFILNKFLVFKR